MYEQQNIPFLMLKKGKWIPQTRGPEKGRYMFYADLFVILFADIIPYMMQNADSSEREGRESKGIKINLRHLSLSCA